MGFDAVLVERPGYVDGGRAIESALVNLGLKRIAGGPGGEMVAYRLK